MSTGAASSQGLIGAMESASKMATHMAIGRRTQLLATYLLHILPCLSVITAWQLA